jgi:tetratricopeptide (TPR) repeat protein
VKRPPPLALCLLLPLLVAVCAWAPSTLARDFAFDDREAIVGNPVVEGSLPAREAFLRDYWHHIGDAGHYRPLATLSLRADHAQFDTWVVGYHLKNLFLQILVVGLACALTLTHFERPRVVLLGLSVFAAHPALADSVAWVSGRTSMLGAMGPIFGAILITTALRLHSKRTALTLAVVGGALGLISGLLGKEEAIVFPLLYWLLSWRRSRAVAVASLVGSLIGLACYLSLRARALGSPLPSAPFAPLAGEPIGTRLLFAGRGLLEAGRLAIAPFHFPPNYRAAPGLSPGAMPAQWAWAGWVGYLGALTLGGHLLWKNYGLVGGGARARIAAGGGILLALVAWAPFTQIVPAGEIFAPRFLYLPLLFLSPALGMLMLKLPRGVIALVLLGLCSGAWRSSASYVDRENYARAILAHIPDDVGAWNDLGLALEETGHVQEAAEAWQEGLARDSNYARIWSNLGRHQLASGLLEEAETSLRRAVANSKRNPIARCNLGALLLRQGRAAEAEEAYLDAARIAPGMAPAWRGLANARLRLGKLTECGTALGEALAQDPTDGLAIAIGMRLKRTLENPGAATQGAQEPGDAAANAAGSLEIEDAPK